MGLFLNFVNREKKLYNLLDKTVIPSQAIPSMCSRKSLHTSSELYTDLPTPLTLNKQRQGLGTGTINLSIDTLWIINQEVEIYISTMDYIFKSVIKLYTYIAGAVGVSCMSTQMHWIYNGECS